MNSSTLTKDLNPQEQLELDSLISAWSWSEGDPIFFAGEQLSGSYLIVAGRVRVARDTVDGREITVDIATPGDIIGVIDSKPGAAQDSAWAMETTCALYLPADALADIVADHPKLALALIRMQQQRLEIARDREISLSTAPVEQRVAAAVKALGEKIGQRQRNGNVLIQVRIRREDIAGLAGTTVESTSRVLARLKKEGVIDSGREWIAIVDEAQLGSLSKDF
ncbi:Crp/Fnr family transcriptional regulator [Corynebacterium crudilactis]|uniref:Crp/Fnr family transcriptional regulator n=1 Tax=Corynebacterium crudilactis TaxID=1652495 RepID=A0A172QSR9_9CORY|nr:Crp/Fnr family transcriptional regulator [Corynebacterium crudilactis]ANE03747.1 Crp/Fnr family transcriptional regulator [Corynebacterium crudilactis]